MKVKKVRIVSKFRFVVFLSFVSLLTIIIAGGALRIDKVYSSTYKDFYEIQIKKGDTLWVISKDNNPNNYDVRKVLHEIMELNNMEEGDIYPGDIIKIPSY